MEAPSIFNDVLGPIMRGPSSSHTAGSYRIGKIAGILLSEQPKKLSFTFDPEGSYAVTYKAQGADRAFICGIMGWHITSGKFFDAIELARVSGVVIDFSTTQLDFADHPNTVLIEITSVTGKQVSMAGKSVGGGNIVISMVNNNNVNITGKEADMQKTLENIPGIEQITEFKPLYFIQSGKPLFMDAEQMVRTAEEESMTLGEIAIKYESMLLNMSENQLNNEMFERYQIMVNSIKEGLDHSKSNMLFLDPTAGNIMQAEKDGKLAVGGLHTRAALYSMAVLHVCNSQGVVCAAPTGGSAGVIPGVVYALSEEKDLNDQQVINMLFAASAIGLIIAKRATFAAEICGCQVEIGAAGAMAAAAVVEYMGGNAGQATAAAAVALQNTMGSVCDLVQGACEIPCHTRNAVAASSAFVCADLILGGYKNPIPLDETIDAAYESGKMLPSEQRCTSKGGIAMAPSAINMKPKR